MGQERTWAAHADSRPTRSSTLVGGRIGAVVGTVAYPADNCGGELWLVSASADSIQLGEMIRYGAGTLQRLVRSSRDAETARCRTPPSRVEAGVM